MDSTSAALASAASFHSFARSSASRRCLACSSACFRAFSRSWLNESRMRSSSTWSPVACTTVCSSSLVTPPSCDHASAATWFASSSALARSSRSERSRNAASMALWALASAFLRSSMRTCAACSACRSRSADSAAAAAATMGERSRSQLSSSHRLRRKLMLLPTRRTSMATASEMNGGRIASLSEYRARHRSSSPTAGSDTTKNSPRGSSSSPATTHARTIWSMGAAAAAAAGATPGTHGGLRRSKRLSAGSETPTSAKRQWEN
mmetsp:Transcript_11122/g.51557  ORF Transcript_11122/g.51557 Transcript_11122/m.51557 type:complete len:264 (-) Transcript_11122:93-884(-)